MSHVLTSHVFQFREVSLGIRERRIPADSVREVVIGGVLPEVVWRIVISHLLWWKRCREAQRILFATM